MAAAVLWAIPVTRPLDLPNWHEFDDATIAQNYLREPSSFSYPRIDWRRDGPGFVESELPLYPWLMAQGYKVFGVHIILGRVLSLAAMLGALVFFGLLARLLLPEAGAFTALLIFATNRIVNLVSTALQPEAFMLLFYLIAVYGFLQWRATRRWSYYALTIVALSMAILEKSPAAHLGLFFLFVLIWEEGWKFVMSLANWCLAGLSLVAPVLWFIHAHKLWIEYGNSLGISNENHWIDWDILHSFLRPAGLVAIEILFVFSLGGLLLAGIAALRFRSRSVKLILLWYAAILISYLVTVRTTGGLWAWYYHIVSVPPMALLCGAAIAGILAAPLRLRQVIAGASIAAVLLAALLFAAGRAQLIGHLNLDPISVAPWQIPLLALVAIAVTVATFWLGRLRDVNAVVKPAPGGFLAAAGLSAYLVLAGWLVANDVSRYYKPSKELQCARTFRPLLPDNILIVASGGSCTDYSGHSVAYDAPQMFYWLNRKGFAICDGQQSIANVEDLAKRGAHYFVAARISVGNTSGFEDELRRHFRLASECSTAWLFDLRHPPD